MDANDKLLDFLKASRYGSSYTSEPAVQNLELELTSLSDHTILLVCYFVTRDLYFAPTLFFGVWQQ